MIRALYTKIEKWFAAQVAAYYHRHAVIAAALSAAAGVVYFAGLAASWHINVALFIVGAIVRDIEKEDGLHAPAWWWVLLPPAVWWWSISVPHTWLLAGGFFYVGREVRDRERLGSWDQPGLWWPVGTCVGLHNLAMVLLPTALRKVG